MRVYLLAGLAAVALLGAPAVLAKDKDGNPPPQPQAYRDLVKCKEIAEPAARLACFDAQVGKLEQATATGEVVMSDRATMREARKGLFGFKLPSLGLFGGGDKDEEISSLDSTVASARTFGYGAWRITLADGSVWEQTDDTRLLFDPRSGNKVHVYSGALGTYRMNVDGQRAIKVRRVE